ncbi:MAG: hypothetical protein ABIR34_04070 [Marmoricola sp.]
MSSFPRAARVLVVLAFATTAAAVPADALAAEHPRSTHQARHHAAHLTPAHRRARKRAEARAAAAEAARVRAARVHALAVAAMKARLRDNKRLPHRASIVFDKFWKNPYNSRIIFRAWAKPHPRKQPRKWFPVEQVSWRAGSGLSGAAGRDECHRGMGWAPNGTYSFIQHNRRKAPLINGRVFELQPLACRNGTLRQLMFIHSEQNWNNTQCRNKSGDDGCRWEVPRVNDYRSYGCIKMAPDDLAALTRHFHRYFRAEVRYPRNIVRLRVKD